MSKTILLITYPFIMLLFLATHTLNVWPSFKIPSLILAVIISLILFYTAYKSFMEQFKD